MPEAGSSSDEAQLPADVVVESLSTNTLQIRRAFHETTNRVPFLAAINGISTPSTRLTRRILHRVQFGPQSAWSGNVFTLRTELSKPPHFLCATSQQTTNEKRHRASVGDHTIELSGNYSVAS
jgi:hypothetical protein